MIVMKSLLIKMLIGGVALGLVVETAPMIEKSVKPLLQHTARTLCPGCMGPR